MTTPQYNSCISRLCILTVNGAESVVVYLLFCECCGLYWGEVETKCLSLSLSLARCQAVQAENVTVLEGGTAQISCRLQNYDGSIVVIQNPRRQTLFFNGTRGVVMREVILLNPLAGLFRSTYWTHSLDCLVLTRSQFIMEEYILGLLNCILPSLPHYAITTLIRPLLPDESSVLKPSVQLALSVRSPVHTINYLVPLAPWGGEPFFCLKAWWTLIGQSQREKGERGVRYCRVWV